MKIAVTGGAGFIGSNMLSALREKYPGAELVSIDHDPQPTYPIDGVKYIEGDIVDPEFVKRVIDGETEQIYHFAAVIGTHESYSDIPTAALANVYGTSVLLDRALETDAKVFNASMPGVWDNPYSITKDAACRLTVPYAELGLAVTGLRYFSAYGERQYTERHTKAVPAFIRAALEGKELTIFGDGNQRADFIYVQDVVSAAMRMMEMKAWGKVVECGTGIGTTVNELASTIIALTNSSSDIRHVEMRAGEPEGQKIIADLRDLQTMFRPTFQPMSLIDGLKRTIQFYDENGFVTGF